MLREEVRIDEDLFPYEWGLLCGMIHPDHLSTPQKMTDSTRTVVWAADYKPFGDATVTVSTITNNLRFPGQYFDAETGINYNLNRDYNQAIGRYIEADPLNLGTISLLFPKRIETLESFFKYEPRSQNLFVYVGNNTLKRADPLGLAEEYPTVPLPPKMLPQPRSPSQKCYLSCKIATIIPCIATGVGIGAATEEWPLGYRTYQVCNWYFTFTCDQICTCQGK
jgi:RHS repeat-associated protein